MNEEIKLAASNSIHQFFRDAKLNNKKWLREIPDFETLVYAFFTIRRRMIQAKKYTVSETAELADSFLKPDILREYENLKHALSTGGDLKKFHTENSKILYPIDGLLEDYGINHLHLSRARFQVFFVEEKEEILILKVCKHFAKNQTAFSKQHLIDLLAQYRPEMAVNGKYRKINTAHPRKTVLYPSSYGWDKSDDFCNWLKSIPESQAGNYRCENHENRILVMWSEKEELGQYPI